MKRPRAAACPIERQTGCLGRTSQSRSKPAGSHAGSHRGEQPSGNPDQHGQRARTCPRSRPDLNGSGRPDMELRICEKVVPATCPIRWSARGHHGHSRTDRQACRSGLQQMTLVAETSLIRKRPQVQVLVPPPRSQRFVPSSTRPPTLRSVGFTSPGCARSSNRMGPFPLAGLPVAHCVA